MPLTYIAKSSCTNPKCRYHLFEVLLSGQSTHHPFCPVCAAAMETHPVGSVSVHHPALKELGPSLASA